MDETRVIPVMQRCNPAHVACSRYHVETVNGYIEERQRQEIAVENQTEAEDLGPLVTFKTWLMGSRTR